MKSLLVISLAFAMSGCANVSYIVDNYRGVEIQEIATQYDTFRVFDKPAENRLMITSSIGSALGQGLAGGAILNPTAFATPEPVFHEAVEKFLAQSGRQCTTQTGNLLATPQWEFRYSCDPAKVALQQ